MTTDSPFRDISARPRAVPERDGGRTRPPPTDRPATSTRCCSAHGGILTVDQLGTVPYRPTWELQDELADQRRRGGSAIGCCCSSTSRSTPWAGAGRGEPAGQPERLREIGAELVRIDRGGDITFHGPGQIVAYPIVELRDPLDLRRYVRSLEAAVIATAAAFGVIGGPARSASRASGSAGELKLAAIGVRVKRGVTTHGLALNVNNDLRWFDEMIPCGIPDKGVTSLALELGAPGPDGRGRGRARPPAGPPASAFG